MLAALVCVVAVMWGVPIMASGVGLRGQSVLWAVLPLQIVWFLYFGIKSFFIACPRCGRSVFTTQWGPLFVSRPWPGKSCSKCGSDLTVSG
jgi:hypothetical protein